MMFKKIILSLSLLTFFFADEASARKVTLVNVTNENIAVDVTGFGVVGGSMMQQKIFFLFDKNKKIWSHRYDAGKMRDYYSNAGAVWHKHFRSLSQKRVGKAISKPVLLPGASVELNFNDALDNGICWAQEDWKVALESTGYKWATYGSFSLSRRTNIYPILRAIYDVKDKIKHIENPSSQSTAVKEELEKIRAVETDINDYKDPQGTNGCMSKHVFIMKKYDANGKATGGLRLLTEESSQVSYDR